MPDTPRYGHEEGQDPDASENAAPNPFNVGLFSAGLIVGPGFHMGDLLTDAERKAVSLAGDLWGVLCGITGHDSTRDADLAELIPHVHALQHAVMAQAAARAYPGTFRPLGGSLREPESPPEKPEAKRVIGHHDPHCDHRWEILRDLGEYVSGDSIIALRVCTKCPGGQYKRTGEPHRWRWVVEDRESPSEPSVSPETIEMLRVALLDGLSAASQVMTRGHRDRIVDEQFARLRPVLASIDANARLYGARHPEEFDEDAETPDPNWLISEIDHAVHRVLGSVVSESALVRIQAEVKPLIEEFVEMLALRHRYAEPKGARLVDVNFRPVEGNIAKWIAANDGPNRFGAVTAVRLDHEAVDLIFADEEHGRTSITLAEHIETGKVVRDGEGQE